MNNTRSSKVFTSTIEMGRPTGTIETPQVTVVYARTDLFDAPKKASKRRSMLIGENVRDAIDSIKGKKDIIQKGRANDRR